MKHRPSQQRRVADLSDADEPTLTSFAAQQTVLAGGWGWGAERNVIGVTWFYLKAPPTIGVTYRFSETLYIQSIVLGDGEGRAENLCYKFIMNVSRMKLCGTSHVFMS
jgi:hypothetical protein